VIIMPKRKKDDLKWVKETLKLSENNNWKSDEGYKIFVAGRGAVRFDIPGDWHMEPKESSFRFCNKKPPDDDCAVEVSFNLLNPQVNWKDLPLTPIVRQLAQKDERDVIEVGTVVQVKRQTAKVVWVELKFMDHQDGVDREAFSRICVGIGSGVQCLITCEFWVDEAEKFVPVWDHVLDTLVLGLFIRDPRTGFALPD
jgi:hypothetical protein